MFRPKNLVAKGGTVKFDPSFIRNAFEHQFGDRIVFANAGGSVARGRAKATSDLDLMLVLDTYQPHDIKLCRRAVQELNTRYPCVGISFQYADELPCDPEDVQDGSKSCLALTYIESAYVLAGENIYAELFMRLPQRALQRSIIRILEEYLHNMYDLAFNHNDADENFRSTAFKFLARAIIDVMLYYHAGDMSSYDDLTSEEVIKKFGSIPQIRHITGDIDSSSSPVKMVQALRGIVLHLKKDYGII